MKTEEEIKALVEERDRRSVEKPLDFAVVKQYLKCFLQHMKELLVKQIDPLQKANFFGLLFNGAPTYGEILSANKNFGDLPKLNELFRIKNDDSGNMVRRSKRSTNGLSSATPALLILVHLWQLIATT